MSQVANTIKDVVNIFKPEPLTREQLGFYQKTAAVRDNSSHNEFYDTLFNRISIADCPTHFLVVGHSGCGKTTELRMLEKKLSDSGNSFYSINVNVADDLDLYNFNYIDILMRIIERMAQYAESNKLKINENIIKAFYNSLATKSIKKYWTKDDETGAEGSINIFGILPFLKAVAGITTSLKMASGFNEELRREIQPNISVIVASLNAFIDHLNELTKKTIVIIIDGLEKGRYECARKLFVEDISALAGIEANLVMTCPLSIFRSPDAAVISSYFIASTVIPMIKTHNKDGSPYQEGINVIRELILKRVSDSFFENNVLETIIVKTGGHLRNAFAVLSNCAFEAHIRGKNTIDMELVNIVINKFATDIFFMVKNHLYKRVKEIYDGDHTSRQDVESFELLYCGAVLEYNGDRWVDLHPLVREYIDNHPGMLD